MSFVITEVLLSVLVCFFKELKSFDKLEFEAVVEDVFALLVEAVDVDFALEDEAVVLVFC